MDRARLRAGAGEGDRTLVARGARNSRNRAWEELRLEAGAFQLLSAADMLGPWSAMTAFYHD
jgi:hypothetical protein